MARERGQLLGFSPVPELDCSVIAAGGEDLAIRRKGHGLDRGAVSRQRDKLLAGNRVPYFGGVIVASRRDVHAVSRIGQTAERQRVSLQDDARIGERGEREQKRNQEPAERLIRECHPGPSLSGRDPVRRCSHASPQHQSSPVMSRTITLWNFNSISPRQSDEWLAR